MIVFCIYTHTYSWSQCNNFTVPAITQINTCIVHLYLFVEVVDFDKVCPVFTTGTLCITPRELRDGFEVVAVLASPSPASGAAETRYDRTLNWIWYSVWTISSVNWTYFKIQQIWRNELSRNRDAHTKLIHSKSRTILTIVVCLYRY